MSFTTTETAGLIPAILRFVQFVVIDYYERAAQRLIEFSLWSGVIVQLHATQL